MTSEDAGRPQGGRPEGRGEDETPRFTDKRRIDPETYEVRTPEEQVLADAEAIASGAEEELGRESEQVQRLTEELARAKADLYNLEQQYSSFVKRSRTEASAAHGRGVAAVAEALVPVLDDVELARQHGDLSGPFASIAEKLESTLGRFGVERYGAVGEVFDPAVHEALMHQHSTEVTEPTVQMVLQPGYRTAERILRAARVAVADPEA
ncbi:nucleotide exchange factor GrpE [Cellulomonas marina]|uniref:Protein GrpE n=1 Tax=Cellulomonas marina TaxID=988821 RepID=A0A1I1A3Q4_9CELL|nr:nucleotide exchange factor GrpE [Cellulomonas marina]GIG30788.1 protein GrpE [Cellulomonas marina]SFB32654.1 molecular chaperone GrpE [Cellulomonas marina]